ncbi:MAG: monooxygenase FAD-binding, partial [Alphaproteobacteria bacterium]
MREERIPVLIAGGSLVGLSTAMFLAWHGIPALVVERHPGTAIHPRAAMFNQRTLELYRSVGIESEILDRANAEFLQDGAIVAVETLAGRELASFLPTLNHGVLDVSPCRRVYCTQNVLEPILRRRAEALGARTRFNVEVSTFETDDDGV